MRLIEAKILNPLLGTELSIPTYSTEGSAAMDLRACIKDPMPLAPHERKLIPTGLAINMMDSGLVAIVASRSGLALKHGIRVAQGIGVVDSDYHGELCVILTNDSEETYHIEPGERIAQLLFQPVIQAKLHVVEDFSVETERGIGGFGSTGKR